MVAAAKPTPRYEKARTAGKLRKQGATPADIAAALGVSRETVKGYLSDPDGSKGRRYRQARTGTCDVCGATTNGPRVRRCRTHAAHGGPVRFWTRERIIEAFRSWALTYGQPPTVNDWSPRFRDSEQRARYYRLRRSYVQNKKPAPIPAATTVYKVFGSWNAATQAAGLKPRPAGGRPRGHKQVCEHGHALTPENRYVYPNGAWSCRTCRREWRRKHKPQKGPKPRCKHGHEFTPENTYRSPGDPNRRVCRECYRRRKRAYRRGLLLG